MWITTFSAFAVDVFYLWESGDTTTAALSASLAVIVAIVAAFGGVLLGRRHAA